MHGDSIDVQGVDADVGKSNSREDLPTTNYNQVHEEITLMVKGKW